MAPEKIELAVTYIESTLQVRLGQCRSVILGGRVFRNLPIYDRGGQNVRTSHAAYATLFKTAIGLKKITICCQIFDKTW